MKINGNPIYVNTIKGFIDQQTKFNESLNSGRKLEQDDPPELKQMREIMRQNKRSLENNEDEKIAKKIARGESITEAEREKLRARNPEKLRKAEEANYKRASISKKLAQAKTKAEAAAIIASEKTTAVAIFEKGDPELGELYLEAVFKAESDYYQKKKGKGAGIKTPIYDGQKKTFDVRL